MTERVLKRANELMKDIEKLRDEGKCLKEIQEKYFGIDLGIQERCFCITVIEGGSKIEAFISADSAKAALDSEIKIVSGGLIELRKEFRELQ